MKSDYDKELTSEEKLVYALNILSEKEKDETKKRELEDIKKALILKTKKSSENK